MKHKAKVKPPSDHDLECRQVLVRCIKSDFDCAMETGTLDPDRRNCIIAYLKNLPRPSVQDPRAETVKAFIRERFARTGKPVSATVIAKYLKEDKEIMVLGNERFVWPGDTVSRDSVRKYIFPLLHQDKDFTCTGRGPSAG